MLFASSRLLCAAREAAISGNHLKNKEAELLKEQQEATNLSVTKTFVEEAVIISDDEQPIQEQLEACKETLATVRQCLQDAKTNKRMAEQSLEQLQQEKANGRRYSLGLLHLHMTVKLYINLALTQELTSLLFLLQALNQNNL